MPAESKSQRRLMGACEHGAGYASCPKGMTKAQMHDFATTKEKGLPMRVKKQAGGMIPRAPRMPAMPKPPRLVGAPRPMRASPITARVSGRLSSSAGMRKGGVAYEDGGVATCGKMKDHGGFADLGIGR